MWLNKTNFNEYLSPTPIDNPEPREVGVDEHSTSEPVPQPDDIEHLMARLEAVRDACAVDHHSAQEERDSHTTERAYDILPTQSRPRRRLRRPS
jgi:hypothetical protein